MKRSTLAAYGFPALPLAALTLPVTLYLPTLYAQNMGLGLTLTGLALLLARLWDGITDPVVGILSDRTRARFGGRRAWIVAGLPLTLAGTWFLLVPPDSAGFLHLLLWSLLLYLGWTLMILPHQAMGAELSSDYHERSRITGWREGFGIMGVLLPLGLIAAFGFSGPAHTFDALKLIALLIMVLLPLSILFLWLKVPEPAEHAPAVPLRLRAGFALLTSNAAFKRLLLAFFINSVANALPATLFLLFVQHVLGRADISGPLLFLYFVCGLSGIPLWLWLSRRFGKHHTWQYAMMLACMIFAAVPFLGTGDVIAFAIVCVLTGLCVGADLVLPPSMQADVIERDAAQAGISRAGLFFALWAMGAKLALAIAAGVFLPLLDALGFNPQGGGALWPLVVCYAILPIIFKLTAIVLMRGYNLNEKTVNQVRG